MIEDRLLVCALEYLCVKLFCIGRRGGYDQVPLTIDKSTQVLECIYIPWHFDGSDVTPSYVDYDRI